MASSVRDSEADSSLISALVKLSQKAPKLVKSSDYKAPALPDVTITSWKLNEFKFYEVPSPFPTLARGLFTRSMPNEGGSPTYRVVARGYDKFFNIGEVPWSSWAALETHTSPPYVLTLKSNGCIIFMAALSPTKLLVTSKHSLGPVKGADMSHAQVGEKWLLKHLEAKGKTPEEFAQVLWDNNWTAVAELCDDSFEEHVLPYSAEKTGLHLHGLNDCSGAFQTQSPETVAAFAREWGFIETLTKTVNTIAEVHEFTDAVEEAGKWQGEPVEGFVVRCHVATTPPSPSDHKTAPPYPPGSSFFFKVKFDEPYMTYRDWREMTKMLLGGHAKGSMESVKVHKSKLRRPESHLYRKWVMEEIRRDKTQFAEFNKGKGIIATRDRFLAWLESERGMQMRAGLQEAPTQGETAVEKDKKFGKTIIVPVAIPGCGKTSVAVALKHLFGFGHTQSDDIHEKKGAPIFIRNVLKELQTHDVVIADKNNHLRQHREALRIAVANMSPPVRLMALNWSLVKPPAMVHRVCADRVMQRGENHQKLRADAVSRDHEDVLWMFVEQTEELADDEVDEVVEMDLEEDLEQALARAVDACVSVLGLKRPTQEEIGQALAVTRGYTPTTKMADAKKKMAEPRYFGFLPEVDLEDVITARLAHDDAPSHAKKFWEALVKKDRVAKRPHITLVHSKELPQEKDLWDQCQRFFADSSPPTFELSLGNLVWNDRVMAIAVDDVKVATQGDNDTHAEGQAFVDELEQTIKKRLHVTVGTGQSNILPIEARALVEGWRLGQSGPNVGSLALDGIVARGRIKGLFS
ncbi:hypothetical protein BD410DRAFT_771066 [Rickenella mellea]|uniref:tRNA ligase n=1 Tax=Rickenella mellea TaxID=50990 RepID=A0A4Y7Q3U0_9AGAM|nr:hypothetical protein BD410DRAFT_771066 [Rickenella mellea]